MTKNISGLADPNIYSAFLRLITASSRIFASLISFSAIAYLMGWIGAKSYFTQFGAAWLTTQLSPMEIFSHALSPLYYFSISLFLVLSSFDEDWPKLYHRESASALLFSIVLLPIFFNGFTKAAIIQRIIEHAPFAFGVVGALVLSFIVIYYSRKDQRSIPFLIFLFALVAGWLLPTATGALRGRSDRDPKNSSLQQIVVKGNPSNSLRLLICSQGYFFVFDDAIAAGQKARIIIVASDNVSYLVGNANPRLTSK